MSSLHLVSHNLDELAEVLSSLHAVKDIVFAVLPLKKQAKLLFFGARLDQLDH